MLPSLLLSLALSAAPSSVPITVVAPGPKVVGVPEERADFYFGYFIQQLEHRGALAVTDRAKVAALLGVERQRQLMGCEEGASECLAEIAGALDAETVLLGSVARPEGVYLITLRLAATGDGRSLASAAVRGGGEGELLAGLDEAAEDFVARAYAGLGRAPPPRTVDRWSEWNALRVSAPLLTVEYLRRISGPWWVGARAGGFGGSRFTVNGGAQLFWATSLAGGLEARYWPHQGFLSWSAYAAVGYSQSQVLDDDLSRREGLVFWLGADLELFSGLSVGLELQLHPPQPGSSGYFHYDEGPALLIFPLISYGHAF